MWERPLPARLRFPSLCREENVNPAASYETVSLNQHKPAAPGVWPFGHNNLRATHQNIPECASHKVSRSSASRLRQTARMRTWWWHFSSRWSCRETLGGYQTSAARYHFRDLNQARGSIERSPISSFRSHFFFYSVHQCRRPAWFIFWNNLQKTRYLQPPTKLLSFFLPLMFLWDLPRD